MNDERLKAVPNLARLEAPPPSILLVEDEAFSLKLERRVLEQIGIRHVIAARDGEEALRYLADDRIKIDVVISDLRMPKMDGIQLLRSVREKRPDLAFVLLTSEASSGTVAAANELGVDGYIVKPFAPASIDRLLSAIMLRRRPELAGTTLRPEERRQLDEIGKPALKRLYELWHERRGTRTMAAYSALRLLGDNDIADLLPHVVLVSVEQDPVRIRYDYVGEVMHPVIGDNVTGRYTDELPAARRKIADPAFRLVLDERRPQFKYVRRVEDLVLIRYQRLLLPLSENGSRIDCILCGFFKF